MVRLNGLLVKHVSPRKITGFEKPAGRKRIELKRVKSRVNRVLDECSNSINSKTNYHAGKSYSTFMIYFYTFYHPSSILH